MRTVSEVLKFWFGELDEEGRTGPGVSKRWFQKNPDFDRQIQEEFLQTYETIANGGLKEWIETPKGRLAYIIVVDQFSRNMFRDSPKMYAADELALEVARAGVEAGEDKELAFAERPFLYMPFMHSEDLGDQQKCVDLFKEFGDELEGEKKEQIAGNLKYAIQHLEIVERFGRFPHRNEILGRESTPEETEFLTTPGSSF